MNDPAIPPSFPRRGTLKIYLGYAAGVGKTYKMLDEGQSLQRDGVDVVIGYFEPHGRKDTIAKAEGLEVVPRRKLEYRGVQLEEMDTAAILSRRPAVCLVDEFAHANVPGAERAKRWQDVQVVLDAAISVITTMNVQHLESLNDQVWQASGIRVRETIPDWVVKQADEVVMVDLPPGALLNRLRRGAVYAPDKANQALENFFKESTLVVLRELALRQTAHEVDMRQLDGADSTLSALSGGDGGGPTAEADAAGAPGQDAHEADAFARLMRHDRILIYVTAEPLTAMLIRRGKRVADYLQTDCFAVAVEPSPGSNHLPPAQRQALDKHLNFARSLHIETLVLPGERPAETLVEFARRQQVTQIFLARPQSKSGLSFFGRSLVQQVVRLARDMQVIIVAERHRARATAP